MPNASVHLPSSHIIIRRRKAGEKDFPKPTSKVLASEIGRVTRAIRLNLVQSRSNRIGYAEIPCWAVGDAISAFHLFIIELLVHLRNLLLYDLTIGFVVVGGAG